MEEWREGRKEGKWEEGRGRTEGGREKGRTEGRKEEENVGGLNIINDRWPLTSLVLI
jgi:hypothetical protein